MATTEHFYTGNNSTTSFAFTFPYLANSDVKVEIDNVLKTENSSGQTNNDYTINNTNIVFNTAPQTGILGPAGQPRLQTTIVPEVKEFPSEVPTSRIKCNINGSTVYLYAMKGIPLVFKGFFRNIDAEIRISTDVPKASWKIVETANENLYTNYTNQGAASSSISYRSPVSRERFIKLYKNPNEIQRISIRSANLRELPATKLINCNLLDFA